MKHDWNWYVTFAPIRHGRLTYADPPEPVLTGTNLETNCKKGMIQLRRIPTGLLLDEVECPIFETSRLCSTICSMRPENDKDVFGTPVLPLSSIRED